MGGWVGFGFGGLGTKKFSQFSSYLGSSIFLSAKKVLKETLKFRIEIIPEVMFLLVFLYPPSSGIAPCVGTAGKVHDTYT